MIEYIEKVSGGGKTQDIINKSNCNSIIITFTIVLEEDMNRRIYNGIFNNVEITHYHQLIWNTAKLIDMPLSVDNFTKYEDKFIFENHKQNIKKYSTIFIDINESSLKNSWVEIIKKYFLEENGKLFIVKDKKYGESYRLNESVAKLTNNILDYEIETTNKTFDKTFYIPCSKTNLSNRINELLSDFNYKTVTILAFKLENIRHIETKINNYEKHLSFITENEEENFIDDSIGLHFFRKQRKKEFNPNSEKLKFSTIESFKGLESEVIFFILTADTSKKDLYHAITRTKNKLYIFDIDNRRFVDGFKLYIDNYEAEKFESLQYSIYMAFVSHIKEDIANDYRVDENTFFERIFIECQKLDIYNHQISNKGEQQIAITHNNTDIVLVCVQSKKQFIPNSRLKIIKKAKEAEKDNYLLCIKIIEKDKFIFLESNKLTIDSKLIVNQYPKDYFTDSEVNLNNEIINISQLMGKTKELSPIIPIEETSEYKKWRVYLELLEKKLEEKSEIFKVDIEYINDYSAKFRKPKNEKLKLKKDEEILFDTKDDEGEKFGIIEKIEKGFVFVELNNSFKDFKQNKFELYVNHIGSKSQIDILKRGLNEIKYNDFRFYIFGDQKLPPLNNWQDLEIEFKNQLNEKQKKAIKKALVSDKLFMIQGPPGTGKTTVISEIAYQESIRGKKVLISSESNDAIENALEKLNEDIFYPILYQSKSREEKDIKTDLPTDKYLGYFYKKRILKELKSKIDNNKNIEKELEDLKLELELKENKILEKILKFSEFEEDKDEIDFYEKRQYSKIEQIYKNYDINSEELKSTAIFTDIQNEFHKELLENKECEDELKNIYFDKINIVGATLNQIGKASKNINNDEIFDVVIVDEVSKATPIELNLAILKAKKVILVGDQKQLPPMLDRDVTLEEFSEKIFKNDDKNYKNKKEVIQELHQHRTVFEKLIDNNPHCYTQLTTQYRMHKNIQNAINQFYDESLECGIDNSQRINQHKLYNGNNLVWIDTTSFKEEESSKSYKNIQEVEQIKKILYQLDKEYKNIDFIPTIGVISFYGLQVNQLNQLSRIENKFNNIKFDFGTVDTFQGQERDFIIISMVRSSSIGFARSLNRINVAFSRAKQLLVILGNKKAFCEIKSYDKNKKDIKIAKEKYNNIYKISHKGELLK